MLHARRFGCLCVSGSRNGGIKRYIILEEQEISGYMDLLHELYSRRSALVQLLKNTDYKAIKAGEGYPGSDWDSVKNQRKLWRMEINKIDEQIKINTPE